VAADARHARRLGVVAILAAASAGIPAIGGAAAVITQHAANASAPVKLYVSQKGSDAGPGTAARPFRSIATAVKRATRNATVVVGSGVYRESIGDVAQPVTIEAAPGATVWISGADVVTGWSAVAGGWVHHNWTTQFCHTCYDPRALDPRFPYAGYPDMAFVNGKALTQVGSVSALRAGTFYVDYAAHNLYVGSNPNGAVVEAATRIEAARFTTAAAGSVVRGIGFKDFASDWNTNPYPAMVLDLAPKMTFDGDTFLGSASRGLSVYAANVTVRASTFIANGFTGFHANTADNLDFEGNTAAYNNTEEFWPGFSPVASVSGVKITSSAHVLVKDNVVEDNYSNGIWFDVSSYDATVVDNFAQANFRNGIYIEITGTSIVASNLSILNGQAGLKLSGATEARVYNTTLADNAEYQLSVHDDGRVNTNPQQIALGITWRAANNTFANNVLSAPRNGEIGPLVYTEDLDKPKNVDASTMITGMVDDVYARSGPNRPTYLAEWTRIAPLPLSKYATLAAFQAATGYESGAIDYTNYSSSPIFVNEAQGNYSLQPGSRLANSGLPLPSDIAAVVGVPCCGAVNRGALVYPGHQ
jgi:hypothetical protein